MWYGRAMTPWKKKSVHLATCHGSSSRITKAAVNMIGAVSPATRAMESTEDVRMPGSAYGSTLVMIAWNLVAPRASEPSR